MISIGQVYCDGCKDAFYPDGFLSADEESVKFCSEECVDDWEAEQAEEQLNLQAYHDGRNGGASVF